jgi:tetratricopeptide (TPR) repeat protein
VLLGGLVLGIFTGCAPSNPNISAAEDALEQQNYEKALSSIETAIEKDSANAEAYLTKAQVLRQMADSTMSADRYRELYKQAYEAEETAAEFDPGVRSDIQGSRQLAYVQQRQRGGQAFNQARQSSDVKEYRKAAAYFGAANAIAPDSASAHLFEAYARFSAERLKESGEANIGKVIPVLERYVDVAAKPDTNAYSLLGQLYLQNDQSEEAIDLLEQATEQYPDRSNLQSLRLTAYNRAGQTQKAMQAYQDQIEQDPDNPTYRYNYGSMLLQADRFEEAIEQLQRAVELEEDNVQAQYNLGAAYVNKALAANDSIATMEDSLRSENRQLTEEEKKKIQSFANQRQQSFRSAIPALERARQLSQQGDDRFLQDACSALFQAYVQTEQVDKASQVEECAGMEQGRAEEMKQGQPDGEEGNGGGSR